MMSDKKKRYDVTDDMSSLNQRVKVPELTEWTSSNF